jgi:hypothetical protein
MFLTCVIYIRESIIAWWDTGGYMLNPMGIKDIYTTERNKGST